MTTYFLNIKKDVWINEIRGISFPKVDFIIKGILGHFLIYPCFFISLTQTIFKTKEREIIFLVNKKKIQ